jgi:hypothetical protein
MPRFRETVPVDDYVIDVLMRDLVGHDRQPAAYLVYLHLYGRAVRSRWRTVPASLRMLAEATGFSKSAVQSALENLRHRELIVTTRDHTTAVPRHRVLRHWRMRTPGSRQR